MGSSCYMTPPLKKVCLKKVVSHTLPPSSFFHLAQGRNGFLLQNTLLACCRPRRIPPAHWFPKQVTPRGKAHAVAFVDGFFGAFENSLNLLFFEWLEQV